jgi:hypothetical protein
MLLCPKGGNDKVYTPDLLALRIVKTALREYPELASSSVLEPCAGKGAFVRAPQACGMIPEVCEIDDGVDFMSFHGNVGWIITNPPWAKIREFLNKSMEVAHDVFFLAVDTPKEFPQSGFQLVVAHISDRFNDAPFMEDL